MGGIWDAFISKNAVDSRFSTLQSLNINPVKLRQSSPAAIKDVQEQLSNAGLYPPPGHKYYRDGSVGGATTHALRLVNEPDYATNYMRLALKDNVITRTDVMRMQAALNRLGHAAGDVDGKLDTDTRKAVERFLKDNPEMRAEQSPRNRDILAPRTGAVGVATRTVDGVREFGHEVIRPDHKAGHTELAEDLQVRMAKDKRIASYVDYTREQAAKNGLDGNMLANQFWKESSYNPNAVSPKGARGIAQMKPSTGARYGLDNLSELHDPKLSIAAGARMMGNLTHRYGSQEMALIAYNGGDKAIDFVRMKTGDRNLSIHGWMEYMADRRESSPSRNPHAWQNETYNYVRNVTGIDGKEMDTAQYAKTSSPEIYFARNPVVTTNIQLQSSFVEAAAKPPELLTQTPEMVAMPEYTPKKSWIPSFGIGD